jgi:protein-L-isoaspartate(D-aspartate) O-methyltransferase
VDRKYFVTSSSGVMAYEDTPLPTMNGQTISAPHMVAIMAEELRAGPGMNVLEIGGGSGYHAAIVSRLISPGGKVISIEVVPDLAGWGRENLKRAGIDNVEMILGDGSIGYAKGSQYDRIYYTAGAPEVPKMVRDQLKDGGIILGVVGPPYGTQRLIRYTKKGDRWEEEKMTHVIFVPLIGEKGY